MKLGPWWSFLIKFFIPFILILILGVDFIDEIRKPYGDYTWTALLTIGVNWLAITFLVALVLSWFPWKRHLS